MTHRHRRIAGVGRRERGRGVEQPRPRHDHARADLAGRARVAIGHVGGGLLVARVNDPDLRRALVERVKRAVELDAGERENGIDAVGDQRSDQRLAARSSARLDDSVRAVISTVSRFPITRFDHQSILPENRLPWTAINSRHPPNPRIVVPADPH